MKVTHAYNLKYYTPTIFEAVLLWFQKLQVYMDGQTLVYYKTLGSSRLYIYEIKRPGDNIVDQYDAFGSN